MSRKQKFIVLFILFIVPLLFYISLQFSTHNFGKLPIVSKGVIDLSFINKESSFEDKVTVLTFLGNNIALADAEIFNLNEKVYKKFYGYSDFQLVSLVAKKEKQKVQQLKKKLSINTNLIKWKFLFTSEREIEALYESLKTNESLDGNYHSKKAFIIDKENNQRRGKSTINELKKLNLFGYNMKSVAELKGDMHDDVKVVLAEYSFALKKNRSEDRRKSRISNEKR
ncbi:MAG TPA: hypothetical protein DDE71_09205 [Tenacibaculum sp.]|nr:hypothetical protein [Tenacibaculum sp.]